MLLQLSRNPDVNLFHRGLKVSGLSLTAGRRNNLHSSIFAKTEQSILQNLAYKPAGAQERCS